MTAVTVHPARPEKLVLFADGEDLYFGEMCEVSVKWNRAANDLKGLCHETAHARNELYYKRKFAAKNRPDFLNPIWRTVEQAKILHMRRSWHRPFKDLGLTAVNTFIFDEEATSPE